MGSNPILRTISHILRTFRRSLALPEHLSIADIADVLEACINQLTDLFDGACGFRDEVITLFVEYRSLAPLHLVRGARKPHPYKYPSLSYRLQ